MNTKIKKSLALILTLCMIFSLMPTFTIGALAEGEVDYTMDFTTPTYASVPNWLGTNVYPEREDCSGTGWSWDVSEKKLTLNGLNFTTSAAYGVLLPGGLGHRSGKWLDKQYYLSNTDQGGFLRNLRIGKILQRSISELVTHNRWQRNVKHHFRQRSNHL